MLVLQLTFQQDFQAQFTDGFSDMTQKKVTVLYFSVLKEQTQKSEETFQTQAATVNEIFDELDKKYQFNINKHMLRISINNEIQTWDDEIHHNDTIIFLPPYSGG